MQLARAEGGQLRLKQSMDLRAIARLVIDEIASTREPGRIRLDMPDQPVNSDIDPDIFGILLRNLVENALRHGSDTQPVEVVLKPDGTLIVSNDGAVIPAAKISELTGRFERANSSVDGAGLGLAIVDAIVKRVGGKLVLSSPRTGHDTGFEAVVRLPVQSGENTEP